MCKDNEKILSTSLDSIGGEGEKIKEWDTVGGLLFLITGGGDIREREYKLNASALFSKLGTHEKNQQWEEWSKSGRISSWSDL